MNSTANTNITADILTSDITSVTNVTSVTTCITKSNKLTKSTIGRRIELTKKLLMQSRVRCDCGKANHATYCSYVLEGENCWNLARAIIHGEEETVDLR